MKRFTLVELMIVVAIIGILAAIAIPSFYNMQLKAKQAEVPVNVDGIVKSGTAYIAQHDVMVLTGDFMYQPTAAPDKELNDWPSGTFFDVIGWTPDGKVRGSYSINVSGGWVAKHGCGGSNTDYACNVGASAICGGGFTDLDGDTKFAGYSQTSDGTDLAGGLELTAGCY